MPLCNQHRLIYVSIFKHDWIIAAGAHAAPHVPATRGALMYVRQVGRLMHVGLEGLIAAADLPHIAAAPHLSHYLCLWLRIICELYLLTYA